MLADLRHGANGTLGGRTLICALTVCTLCVVSCNDALVDVESGEERSNPLATHYSMHTAPNSPALVSGACVDSFYETDPGQDTSLGELFVWVCDASGGYMVGTVTLQPFSAMHDPRDSVEPITATSIAGECDDKTGANLVVLLRVKGPANCMDMSTPLQRKLLIGVTYRFSTSRAADELLTRWHSINNAPDLRVLIISGKVEDYHGAREVSAIEPATPFRYRICHVIHDGNSFGEQGAGPAGCGTSSVFFSPVIHARHLPVHSRGTLIEVVMGHEPGTDRAAVYEWRASIKYGTARIVPVSPALPGYQITFAPGVKDYCQSDAPDGTGDGNPSTIYCPAEVWAFGKSTGTNAFTVHGWLAGR